MSVPATASTIIGFLVEQISYDPDTGMPTRSYSTAVQAYNAILHVNIHLDRVGGHYGSAVFAKVEVQRYLKQLKQQYDDVPVALRATKRNLTENQFVSMIYEARRGASTWQQRYCERRDTALMFIIGHTAMRTSQVSSLTRGDLRHAAGVWKAVTRTSYRPVARVWSHPKIQICAPCGWFRWLEVHDALNSEQPHVLERLLDGDDVPADHVCAGTPSEPFDEQSPLFPAGKPTALSKRPLSGHTALSIVKNRTAAIPPHFDSTGYGVDSIKAAFGVTSLRPFRHYEHAFEAYIDD